MCKQRCLYYNGICLIAGDAAVDTQPSIGISKKFQNIFICHVPEEEHRFERRRREQILFDFLFAKPIVIRKIYPMVWHAQKYLLQKLLTLFDLQIDLQTSE